MSTKCPVTWASPDGRTGRQTDGKELNPVRKVSETVSLPFADGHPNKPTYSTGRVHPYTVKVTYIYTNIYIGYWISIFKKRGF